MIPFTYLGIIIDAELIVQKEVVPTLISMKDMVVNGLDISTKERYICWEKKKQKLQLEKYFLIHELSPSDFQ